ncbi:hypothetical protein MPER_10449 [Moniliophthora perniciosa FA553]|nr:hypothetical protein MPER_10449 [Moniliophthora perniciosa FA553]
MSPESKNQFSQDQVENLQGRTAIVTGATNGIGYEVAKALAEAQAKVILLSRKEEKGEEAIQEIKKLQPTADVHFTSCDLGNLKQVREVSDRLRSSEERLDIVRVSEMTWYGIDANSPRSLSHMPVLVSINTDVTGDTIESTFVPTTWDHSF